MPEPQKVLIIYPYITEDIFKILKKFSGIDNKIQFLCILPSNYKKSIYLTDDINFDVLNLPKNIKLERCYFIFRKNKNPIINPFSLFYFLTKFRPNKILLLDEAFSPNALIISLMRSLFHFEVYFYSFENVIKKLNLFKKLAIAIIKKNIKYGFVCNKEALEVFKANNYFPIVKQVWWGVDTELFSQDIGLNEKIKIKKSLGINKEQKVIGYIGRFIEEKGIKDLIEVFKLLDNNIVLIFIGDGPLKIYLEQMKDYFIIQDKKIIILPPQNRSNLAKYYKIIDVLILPSKTTNFWKEQYGRVLIEAMASGVSVVGSNSGAIPEIIDNVGSIFTEGNINALKEAILYELNNRNEDQVIKLKERSNLGSIDNFAKEIISFIKENE